MNVYDVKLDNKGRIMLPKKIRDKFIDGARIIDNGSLSYVLEPLIDEIVTAEIEVMSDFKDLCVDAWQLNVSVFPCEEANNIHVIRVKGKFNDVKEFAACHGTSEDDFEEHIIDDDN